MSVNYAKSVTKSREKPLFYQKTIVPEIFYFSEKT